MHAVVTRLSANFAAMSAAVRQGFGRPDRTGPPAGRPPVRAATRTATGAATDAHSAAVHAARRGVRATTCTAAARSRSPAAALTRRRPPRAPRPPRDASWIGKVLAVAGVAVTLIGVVLLLVLAAQAGILRPEIRVGAGAVLAGALVAVAARLQRPPGGRVGAIALAATGVAAAYMDVIAITTIYDWVSAPVGLVIAAVIGGGGLTLARRWDSPAPRPAGAGAADRARADRHRRHHDAVDRVHACHLGRIAARAARQGLDLAARGPNHGADVPAAWSRWSRPVSATPTTPGWPVAAQSPPRSPSSAR